jgi:hypothetical protein
MATDCTVQREQSQNTHLLVYRSLHKVYSFMARSARVQQVVGGAVGIVNSFNSTTLPRQKEWQVYRMKTSCFVGDVVDCCMSETISKSEILLCEVSI